MSRADGDRIGKRGEDVCGSKQVSQKKEDQLARDSREPGRQMTTALLVSIVENLV